MDNRAFWANRDAWPASTEERIFLCEAMQEIGGALFGQDWTGKEPEAFAPVNLEWEHDKISGIPFPLEAATVDQRRAALRLLELYRPDISGVTRSGRFRRIDALLDRHQWMTALEIAERHNAAYAAPYGRFREALELVAAKLMADELNGILIDRDTGEAKPLLDATDWRRDRIKHCLEAGGFPKQDTKAFRWLFISRDSLDKWLAGQKPTAAKENRALAALADIIKTNTDIRKADAKNQLASAGHVVSDRGFDRIWPDARRMIGLSPRAKAGAKPKSGH